MDRDFQAPELVIDVPKVILDVIPLRTLVPELQTAEQLMEVLTPFYIFEQNVDFPFRRLVLLVEVNKVFSLDRARLASRSLTFQPQVVEVLAVFQVFPQNRARRSDSLVLTVFSQDRVQRRLLHLITWMCTCQTPLSGFSFAMTPRVSPISGLGRREGLWREGLVLGQGYPCQYI